MTAERLMETDVPSSSSQPKSRKKSVVRPHSSVSIEDLLPRAIEILLHSLDTELEKSISTPIEAEISALVLKIKELPISQLQDIFATILKSVWEVTERGRHMAVGSSSNAVLWKGFHELRLNDGLATKWQEFVVGLDVEISEFSIGFLLQGVLEGTVKTILGIRNEHKEHETASREEFSIHDEQVLRYVAGFVPFALRKRYRRQKSQVASEFVRFLDGLRAKEDNHTQADSFLAYTSVWTTVQNRGGLFEVHDECYKLFRAMELETRKHVSDELLLQGRAEPIKDILHGAVLNNMHVLNMWNRIQGCDLPHGDELLKTMVRYWVEIRLRAYVKLFMDKRRDEAKASKREKGLRKKLKEQKK
nr:uncharacterized protein LOC129282483 [Lytechinus pictus]